MKRLGKDQEKIYPRLWSFGDGKLKFVFYILKNNLLKKAV